MKKRRFFKLTKCGRSEDIKKEAKTLRQTPHVPQGKPDDFQIIMPRVFL